MEWWPCQLNLDKMVWVQREYNGIFIEEYFMTGKTQEQKDQYLSECINAGWVSETEP